MEELIYIPIVQRLLNEAYTEAASPRGYSVTSTVAISKPEFRKMLEEMELGKNLTGSLFRLVDPVNSKSEMGNVFYDDSNNPIILTLDIGEKAHFLNRFPLSRLPSLLQSIPEMIRRPEVIKIPHITRSPTPRVYNARSKR